MKKKFVIVSPRQRFGGPMVLHVLCKTLDDQGYNAKIFYIETLDYKNENKFILILKMIKFLIVDTYKVILVKLFGKKRFEKNPKYKGYAYYPIHNCKRKFLPIVGKNTIVIYPEIVYGNLLKAKKVVRWLLYYNKYGNDEKAYGKKDLFFCYNIKFNDWNLNPKGRRLHTVSMDLDLYKQTNFMERKGCCYIIRKGKNRDDLPDNFDGPIIDGMTEREIVRTFNNYKYCISYDTHTFYVKIAALCGCIPIVIPEKGKSRRDYVEDGYGVAYGMNESEIEYAIQTREKLCDRIRDDMQENKRSIKYLLDVCDKYFFS